MGFHGSIPARIFAAQSVSALKQASCPSVHKSASAEPHRLRNLGGTFPFGGQRVVDSLGGSRPRSCTRLPRATAYQGNLRRNSFRDLFRGLSIVHHLPPFHRISDRVIDNLNLVLEKDLHTGYIQLGSLT